MSDNSELESPLTEKELAIARKYDLTPKVIPFLDRHLIYPLIESSELLYDEKTVNQLIYDLLKDTNMISFIKDQYSLLNPDAELFPKELVEKEKFIEKELLRLENETEHTLDILSRKEVQEHLKQDKTYNWEYLEKEHGISEKDINALYEFGQFQYNRGDYVMASDLLNNFKVLSTNGELIVFATWGRFASEIITLQWDTALQELSKLREVVDSRSMKDPLLQLHHRTWIIHWALFPFFNTDQNGLDQLCDLFFSSSYLSTIQASCPWLLRYLVAAVVSTSSKSHSSPTFQKRLKDLIRVVEQEQYEYNDPLTDFIKALYIDFDFDQARFKLEEVAAIIKTDFFLVNGGGSFLENARYLISEVYCRVHQTIDLNLLSKSLNLSKDDGEKWIAKLIRDSKMDAKINESDGTVVMNHPVSGIYQEVIEKTKGLSFRSNQVLLSAMQKSVD
ncbi:eukaryotic translation initiation factor 3 subunit E [Ascoidea rubescens DSM 1968]|uniref:Eukaryotic translation initiation factor 3 subunit E n=1 Tax=Ascoidea rubescens DSM 1968 TaxID=1344418 RepID=A0A1D2VFM8_9ASCO|nr:eukaryotic translation initiation factor 3 subunit E [Ascoidea rubescens DSM 1968]ODV60461.1 eukaryotic translation initiation factor 3 subunit E [Ascoidea rubescens DSM 1968]